MGLSAGPGSPFHFACPGYRALPREERLSPGREGHVVLPTGDRFVHRPAGALGLHSTHVARRWKCQCGRAGWSTHIDLARALGDDPRWAPPPGIKSGTPVLAADDGSLHV